VRGLYAVTPDTTDTAWLARAVSAAVRGGASLVQYRNKRADAATRHAQAAALKHALADSATLLIINDDVAVAAAIGADGVHVGEDDASLDDARRALGDRAVIGVSCYNDAARARRAIAGGASYVAFGSFFASTVKPEARRADIALLQDARAFGVPVVAIGGITADNAPILRDAGADAVAVISAVFAHDSDDAIERAARTIALAMR